MARTHVQLLPGTDTDRLRCPGCSSTFLNQERITVYDRKEDETHVVRTICSEQRAVSERIPDVVGCGNPSDRRQGLAIQFECENCDVFPVLYVYQHKGETILDWA